MPDRPPIAVAVGIVLRGRQTLICRRPPGVPLSGLWEFPGGKLEPGETPEAAAVRELREELGIGVDPYARLGPIRHAYEHGDIDLTPVLCRHRHGDPRTIGCAEFRWVSLQDLSQYAFPAANRTLLSELSRLSLSDPTADADSP